MKLLSCFIDYIFVGRANKSKITLEGNRNQQASLSTWVYSQEGLFVWGLDCSWNLRILLSVSFLSTILLHQWPRSGLEQMAAGISKLLLFGKIWEKDLKGPQLKNLKFIKKSPLKQRSNKCWFLLLRKGCSNSDRPFIHFYF